MFPPRRVERRAAYKGCTMHDDLQDDTLTKLQDQKSQLEERLRLLEAEEKSDRGDGPLTETPETVRDQLDQVNRLIAEHAQEG